MKKILQIPNYLYPHVGGIEQVARDILWALKGEDVEQKIICFNEDARDGMMICRRKETAHDRVDGIEVVRCGCIAKIRSQSISPRYPSELKKMIHDFSPDVIIFHYPNPYVAHWLLKYLPKDTKLFLYWHLDIVKQVLLRHLFEGQTQRLIARADRVIATSPNYVEGSPWLCKAKAKCTVIPNCISTERLEKTPQAESIARKIREENPDKIICVSVGRHVKYKGITYLIQAAKQLDSRFLIYIIGNGEETEALKQEARGIDSIHFLGTVTDDELKGWLAAADIFCFPSITKNEAFGLALAEAMYYEKPAVTFTIPGSGVNYVCLNGETGIEVPGGDAAAYARAMKTLADDPEMRRRLGQNARKRVEENFTSAIYREKILAVLR
ncbi:MAG: glycosyltransferase [Clostridia bacterium]|nr:glycosyltransferase [Clostridia bacterium]